LNGLIIASTFFIWLSILLLSWFVWGPCPKRGGYSPCEASPPERGGTARFVEPAVFGKRVWT
jgi:hypothetical protein